MMRLSKLAAIAVVPALGVTLLAGCASGIHFNVSSGGATATCSVSTSGGHCSANGHSVTVAPGGHASGPAAHASQTPTPADSSPLPAFTTQAPSTTPTPQSTFDANAISAVQNCMSQFPTQAKDTLVSFSTSASARENMAVCLQMPPQTVALFLHLLFKYAYAAYVQGDFDTQQGQEGFVNTTQGDTLPAAVIRCDKHYTGTAG